VDKQDIETTYNFADYPQDVHKKVLVYSRFKEHFEPAIKKLAPIVKFLFSLIYSSPIRRMKMI